MSKRSKRPDDENLTKTRRKHHHDDWHADEVKTLLQLERLIMALAQSVNDALQAQDIKIAALAKTVDDFIAQNTAGDAAALVQRINAQGVAVDQIAAKLTTTP